MELSEDELFKIREALEAGRYHALSSINSPQQREQSQEAIRDMNLIESVLEQVDELV